MWRCIKSTCILSRRLQGEEMRYALDLLQDCTSARVSEWALYTTPEGHQLFTPTLQLRCSAVEATAKLLKNFLPSELNTVDYLLCTVPHDICLALCFGCRRLHHLACKRVWDHGTTCIADKDAATPSSTARSEHLDSFQSASSTTLPCHSDEKPSHRTSAAAALPGKYPDSVINGCCTSDT